MQKITHSMTIFCTVFQNFIYNNVCLLVCKVLWQKFNIILFPEESPSLHASCTIKAMSFLRKEKKKKSKICIVVYDPAKVL